MLVQMFHSINEVDLEFIPGIEDLLKEEMPDIDWIKSEEEQHQQNTTFNYYLFFANGKNSPIGIARAQINREQLGANNFFNKFKNKKLTTQAVSWELPGTTRRGLIYNPIFESDILSKFKSIKAQVAKRENLISEAIISDCENILNIFEGSKNDYGLEMTSIKKAQDDFEKFLLQRGLDQDQVGEKLGHTLHENKLKVEFHKDFKSIFYNRGNGVDLYAQLKKDPSLTPWIRREAKFMGLWKDQELLALIPIFLKQHYFYFSFVPFTDFNLELKRAVLILVFDHFFHRDHSFELIFAQSPAVKQKLICNDLLNEFSLPSRRTLIQKNKYSLK